jgi:hypothetical protein
MGYYTIRLDPDASKICTIIFPWGKYSYKRLPMGINIVRGKLIPYFFLHSQQKTYAWLLVSKLTAHEYITPTQLRGHFLPYQGFFSLSHDDSSFVGASDVSQFLYGMNTYFWCARLRPDARRVPKARLLSQTLAYPEVATRHIIAISQDCRS